MRIFISYPDSDQSLARAVKQLCEELGHDCFIAADATEALSDGEGWLAGLIKQIDSSDIFVLCLTSPSCRARMQKTEWQYVFPKQMPHKLVVHEGHGTEPTTPLFLGSGHCSAFVSTTRKVEPRLAARCRSRRRRRNDSFS